MYKSVADIPDQLKEIVEITKGWDSLPESPYRLLPLNLCAGPLGIFYDVDNPVVYSKEDWLCARKILLSDVYDEEEYLNSLGVSKVVTTRYIGFRGASFCSSRSALLSLIVGDDYEMFRNLSEQFVKKEKRRIMRAYLDTFDD